MSAPLESVLIANRGEIACRIIRTCRRLGVRSIAVFSDADAGALHVTMADERHHIGPSEAAHSYLRPEAIIAAAQAHRASAIHPGYGFLSERVELAELCAAAGLIWVGPSIRCISVMGSKIGAKSLARIAGVPVVPGYNSENQSADRLAQEAAAIGFPLLIKASAGGGGKGMRRVDDQADFPAALQVAKAEALAAFGDDRVLLEKLIAQPRHLEVQIAGDRHGHVVHLFERECSIQRNYQKLVEEAPAPHLPDAVRARLLDSAVRLGRSIGYYSLGTVEFILGADGDGPYFLEMNTRLQVEHPVTEMITGLDLVELQLRIAAGEKLPFGQDGVSARGHAIEVRVNAEDPAAGYRPNLGVVTHYAAPSGPGVRVDSGIQVGSEVTPHYDSLLLKVIAHAPDRAGACHRLGDALTALRIAGVATNQAFLGDILRTPAFDAMLSTDFISQTFPTGWHAPPAEPAVLAAAAIAMASRLREDAVAGPWGALAGFRVAGFAGLSGRCPISVCPEGGEPVVVTVLGSQAEIDGVAVPPQEGGGHVDGIWVTVFGTATWRLMAVPLIAALGRRAPSPPSPDRDVVATMPGLITAVLVEPGQEVAAGDVVVVQESMKLVLRLAAPRAGTVKRIFCRQGQTVTTGARLVELLAAGERAG